MLPSSHAYTHTHISEKCIAEKETGRWGSGGGGSICIPLLKKFLSADNYFMKCNKHPKNSKQLIIYPRLLLWLQARI